MNKDFVKKENFFKIIKINLRNKDELIGVICGENDYGAKNYLIYLIDGKRIKIYARDILSITEDVKVSNKVVEIFNQIIELEKKIPKLVEERDQHFEKLNKEITNSDNKITNHLSELNKLATGYK